MSLNPRQCEYVADLFNKAINLMLSGKTELTTGQKYKIQAFSKRCWRSFKFLDAPTIAENNIVIKLLNEMGVKRPLERAELVGHTIEHLKKQIDYQRGDLIKGCRSAFIGTYLN